MINEPPTTTNTPSLDLGTNDKRYPRPQWLRVLREIFLRWWLIPLTCLIIYIFIVAFNLYTHSDIYHALLLPFFITYWWIVIPTLAIAITLLFLAYGWANGDESREYRVQQEQRQRELEQEPPPSGFKLQHTLRGHTEEIRQIAWSPDGRLLTSGSNDQTVRLWDVATGQALHTLTGHTDPVGSVAWSSDGRLLASSSGDQTVRLWDGVTGQALHTLTGHTSLVLSVAWSPDGRQLASGSGDRTVRLWDVTTGRQIRALEGHTASILTISFSADSRILASKSDDGTVRLWKVDTWEEVTSLYESSNELSFGVAFHPKLPILATLGEGDTIIRIWHLDFDVILAKAPDASQAQYTNARVVLVGHPGYRLIHQLHLSEVSVALVVFDGRSETDPFAGVQHWERALRIAQQAQGSSALPLKKFLVGARMDRGGIGVSRSRIEALVREMGFDGYYETSAKEGFGIEQLQVVIAQAIDWAVLPKVSSTTLFQSIKDFLAAQKKAGRLLSTVDDLYHTFLKEEVAPQETETLRAQFETCIGRVESSGLIRRLSFGNFVLLQSELLDAYASALVNAVKDEPDGLGSIAEAKVLAGNFAMPADERIKNKEQEKMLLIAMIEDLLRNEIALRANSEDGIQLVFPSQSTRENAELPDPEEKTASSASRGRYSTSMLPSVCVSPIVASFEKGNSGGTPSPTRPVLGAPVVCSCTIAAKEVANSPSSSTKPPAHRPVSNSRITSTSICNVAPSPPLSNASVSSPVPNVPSPSPTNSSACVESAAWTGWTAPTAELTSLSLTVKNNSQQPLRQQCKLWTALLISNVIVKPPSPSWQAK